MANYVIPKIIDLGEPLKVVDERSNLVKVTFQEYYSGNYIHDWALPSQKSV